MVGVPARTREDALAALDWLTKEGADLDELNAPGAHSTPAGRNASSIDASYGVLVSPVAGAWVLGCVIAGA
jgi:hypothetical protein